MVPTPGNRRSLREALVELASRYYKARICYPIVALAAETGDILDVRLRQGAVHTADGALAFILELVDSRGGEPV